MATDKIEYQKGSESGYTGADAAGNGVQGIEADTQAWMQHVTKKQNDLPQWLPELGLQCKSGGACLLAYQALAQTCLQLSHRCTGPSASGCCSVALHPAGRCQSTAAAILLLVSVAAILNPVPGSCSQAVTLQLSALMSS